ncbi:MAG: hypothetical protein LKE89_02255 [Lactobacillaceae bacterium]|jgi:hypothetical protein|nr:hypothetical protein [Lactobacillaceae bacterium]
MKEIVKVNVANLRQDSHTLKTACFLRTAHCTIKVFNGIEPQLFAALMKVVLEDGK